MTEKKELECQGYTLICTDETCIHSSYTKRSCWHGSGVEGVHVPLNHGKRLIVVHAGSRAGFVPGTKLLYTAAASTGDYHGEMNGERFTKWLQEMLIPSLPGKCAVVLDNASYHSMHDDKSPTTGWNKDTIKSWLRKHGILFEDGMTKNQLLQLFRMHRPTEPAFTIDCIIRRHGHEVLRLPPYHPDFNPLQLIWSQLKNNIVRQRNVIFRFDDLKRITDDAFDEIGSDIWSPAIDHAESRIKEMQRSDHYTGKQPTEVVINLTGSDPEDTDTADECGSSTDTVSEAGSSVETASED